MQKYLAPILLILLPATALASPLRPATFFGVTLGSNYQEAARALNVNAHGVTRDCEVLGYACFIKLEPYSVRLHKASIVFTPTPLEGDSHYTRCMAVSVALHERFGKPTRSFNHGIGQRDPLVLTSSDLEAGRVFFSETWEVGDVRVEHACAKMPDRAPFLHVVHYVYRDLKATAPIKTKPSNPF